MTTTALTGEMPQHMRALALGNRIRLERAAALRALFAGTQTVADVIGLECVQSMRVTDLLAGQKRWGAVRARRVLRAAGVSEYRHVCDLTDRQVGAIVALTTSPTGAPA